MVCSHRCSAEEGTPAPLLPETAEEVWNEPQHPQIILHLHRGEHPDRLHHHLVWKQHSFGVVRTACHIVGGELPSLQDIYTRRCIRKARRIIKDSSHPSHSLLSLLPSGKRLRSIWSRTSWLRDSFFPQAIIYIYVFSSAFRLYMFCQHVCSLGIEPTTNALTTEPQEQLSG